MDGGKVLDVSYVSESPRSFSEGIWSTKPTVGLVQRCHAPEETSSFQPDLHTINYAFTETVNIFTETVNIFTEMVNIFTETVKSETLPTR